MRRTHMGYWRYWRSGVCSSDLSRRRRRSPYRRSRHWISVSTMSSEISTNTDQGLQPWQFFVLAGLGCATAVLFIARGRGVAAIVLLSLVIAATALVGLAALRTFKPLVSPEDDRTVMYGHRTRVALEREKLLALRSIKELE